MKYRRKKHTEREDAPVVTLKDERGRERQSQTEKRDSDAPDGISGSWS